MPIVVEYGPPADLIGQIAYQSGYGQYAQRQAEIARQEGLRRQQLALQQAHLAQQSQRLRMQKEAQQEAIRMAELQRIDALNRERQAATQQAAPGRAVPDNWNWQVGSAENLEKEIAAIRAADSKRQFTEEGQRIHGELSGQLRAIQRQRASLRPAQYSQLLAQWLQRYEQAGLPNYAVEEPTPEQLLSQRLVTRGGMQFLYEPDGKGSGKFTKIDGGKDNFLADDKAYKAAAEAIAQRKAMTEKLPPGWQPPPHEVFNEMLQHRQQQEQFAQYAPMIQNLQQQGVEVMGFDEQGRLKIRQPGQSPQVIDAQGRLAQPGPPREQVSAFIRPLVEAVGTGNKNAAMENLVALRELLQQPATPEQAFVAEKAGPLFTAIANDRFNEAGQHLTEIVNALYPPAAAPAAAPAAPAAPPTAAPPTAAPPAAQSAPVAAAPLPAAPAPTAPPQGAFNLHQAGPAVQTIFRQSLPQPQTVDEVEKKVRPGQLFIWTDGTIRRRSTMARRQTSEADPEARGVPYGMLYQGSDGIVRRNLANTTE